MKIRRPGAKQGAITIVVVIALAVSAAVFLRMRRPEPYLVGAYYYGWYDGGHWAGLGYLGPHLPEPLEPGLGEYDSRDPDVVSAHVRWASDYGIDFLILDWQGRDTTEDRQALNLLLPMLANSTVRQAPVIDLLAYGDIGNLDLSGAELRTRLREDARYLGSHYLNHPSAMRVNGRPLLFIYIARRLQGDVGGWIRDVRLDLGAIGVNPFIVGDEVFWQEADPNRVHIYDAVTPYNVYDWPLTQHRGWAERSSFFADVEGLFTRWRDVARTAGVAFVPNVMPGYNDRGVRLAEDHFVIPRQLGPNGSSTGFLERSIELATRYVDPQLRMVTITSFNEWHEWTQIEPSRRIREATPPADADAYTEGFPHAGYDFDYLEVIRDRLGDRAAR